MSPVALLEDSSELKEASKVSRVIGYTQNLVLYPSLSTRWSKNKCCTYLGNFYPEFGLALIQNVLVLKREGMLAHSTAKPTISICFHVQLIFYEQ